jgi:hypothetical protein
LIFNTCKNNIQDMPSYYPAFDKDYEDFLVSKDYLKYLEEIKFYRTEFEN